MKTLFWISSAKRDLLKLPDSIKKAFGYGLHQAQMGDFPDIAKVLKGFGSSEVLELKEDDRHGTYRAVYTVRFSNSIFVLHAFQKKSKKGIKTSKEDIDLIKSRLKMAEEIYKEWKARKK